MLTLFAGILKLCLRSRKLAERQLPHYGSIAWLWMQMADHHRIALSHGEEERCLKHYIALLPEDAKGYERLAVVHLAQNRYNDAIAAADKVLVYDRNHEYAYQLKGMAFLSLGEWEESVRQFRQALWISDVDWLDGWVHARMASVYEMLGQLEEAGKHWRRAIELNPDVRKPDDE